MARATWTKSSRKNHICGRCQRVIHPPEGYWSASPGFRGRAIFRCMEHPFRASELTTSLRSEPLAAVENFTDAASVGFESMEELESAWEELTSAIQEYVDTRQGALDEWENGNSQLEELLDVAQSALDEVESHTFEEFDSEEPSTADEWAEWDEARAEHLDEQTQDAVAVAEGLDL